MENYDSFLARFDFLTEMTMENLTPPFTLQLEPDEFSSHPQVLLFQLMCKLTVTPSKSRSHSHLIEEFNLPPDEEGD
jgi:hypothetical protein